MHVAKDAYEFPQKRFESIRQIDVPRGREGKHKEVVIQLLSDLNLLEPGFALKVPLTALRDPKENIRSALSRAAHQRGFEVASSSDQDFLYFWKVVH
jgi:hypothetical protein